MGKDSEPGRKAARTAFAGSGGRRAMPECRGSLVPGKTGGGSGGGIRGAAAPACFFRACGAFEPK